MQTGSPRAAIWALVAAVVFLAPAAGAKKRTPFERRAGTLAVGGSFPIPITDEGACFVPGINAGYQILDHLGVGLGFGYSITDQGESFPSNIVLGVNSTWWTDNRKGLNAFIGGRLGLGLGVFELGGKGDARAAAFGLVNDQDWLRFYTESLVIEPVVLGGISTGTFRLLGEVGPAVGLPLYNRDARDTEVGLDYRLLLGGGFGDWRGGLFFGMGFAGISQLTGDQKHSYALDLGIDLYLGSVGLYPRVGVRIPLNEDKQGVNAIVTAGLVWRYELFEEEEKEEDE